jgi:hypothetical protein
VLSEAVDGVVLCSAPSWLSLGAVLSPSQAFYVAFSLFPGERAVGFPTA